MILSRHPAFTRGITLIRSNTAETTLWFTLALCLTIIALVPVWLVPFPPLQDYPFHLLRVHIIANYANPSFNYDELFSLNLFPIPYILTDYIHVLLSGFFSIPVAGKIVLSIYIVLFPLSVFYFVRSVDQHKTVFGFFAFLFIYNWYFNKGFVGFVFGIPFYLFALGYWWRVKDRLAWRQQLIMALLILGIYLSHLYVYAFFLYTFVIVVVLAYRNIRKIAVALVPLLPSLLLLGTAVLMHAHGSTGQTDFVAFQYPTLRRKLEIAPKYYISFAHEREKFIILGIGIITIVLFLFNITNIRALTRNIFLVVTFMLGVLYLALPDFISPRYNYFDCRVLIFIVLVGLAVLAVPKNVYLRAGLVLTLTALSLIQLGGILGDYRSANSELADYYNAIEQIPAEQYVAFKVERDVMYIERMTPFAFFGAYYYIEKTSDSSMLPAYFGGFISTLRLIQYRETARDPDDASESIEKTFARGEIPVGGYTVVIVRGDDGEIEAAAARQGYEAVARIGQLHIYRRVRVPQPEAPDAPATPAYYTVLAQQEPDYVLIYQDTVKYPLEEPGYTHVFSSGYAHLLQRRGQ